MNTHRPHPTAGLIPAVLSVIVVLAFANPPAFAEGAAGTEATGATWSIPWPWWIAPIGSLVALVFAWVFFKQVKASNQGDEKMKEIGAKANILEHLDEFRRQLHTYMDAFANG